MTIALHNLEPRKAVNKKKKRVGRGNASGHGTYSTRGLKGQKSRSGVSGLKRLGMKQMLLSVPKVRGFKSAQPKLNVVNLDSISRLFKDGAQINPQTLRRAGLIDNAKTGVKILGRGELTVKNLVFSGVTVSETARQSITAQGGSIK